MDWFERLAGFKETNYEATRKQLKVEGNRLHSRVNGQSHGIGELELVSLQTLRERVLAAGGLPGRLKVDLVSGDVQAMHRSPKNVGALFQVASQFNLLEMVGPSVTPEDGVTKYQTDGTQGPACAIAAGAATIYRNYFAPVGDGIGQTTERQIDGLAPVGALLSKALGQPVTALWRMENGYASCSKTGLDSIGKHLATLDEAGKDVLRAALCVGVHRDVEVTIAEGPDRPLVSQIFCSALPVAYSRLPTTLWSSFASLILEAAYEATLLAAVCNAQRGVSNKVLLTRLGGGAFGNDDHWIGAAMQRALTLVQDHDLQVTLVSYGQPTAATCQMAAAFE